MEQRSSQNQTDVNSKGTTVDVDFDNRNKGTTVLKSSSNFENQGESFLVLQILKNVNFFISF